MPYQITSCSKEELEYIKKFISAFELDERELQSEEFLLIKQNKCIIGFGRIREHSNCSELCTLGVIEPERNKGAGTFLCKALLKKAQQKLYLVCIIPRFFMKLGFRETNDYPDAVSEKLNYCIDCLPVSETYVAMQHTF